MLNVLFGSWVGIISFAAIVLTIVAVVGVLGFCWWNAGKAAKQ